MVTSIGGPFGPDLSTCVRVDPGAYLRVASDALMRRLVEGSRTALPLCEAIQAAQMLDMFFPRDGVMGVADGHLNHFRRYWAYHCASHLDNPDPGWRYQPLMVAARVLGLGSVPASPLAAVSSPASAPDPSGRRDERLSDQRERGSRHGRREWRDQDGWGGWDDRDAWDGRDGRRERGDGYDTGSDDGYGRSGRLRSRRPRRSCDWSSGGSRSDGRGGPCRRRLSITGGRGGGSAFARFFRLGLLREVIDVDDGRLVRLRDSRGYPGCGLVTRDEWLRRYTQTVDVRGPGTRPVVALPGACSAEGGGERVGEACGLPALPFPPAPERLTPTAPPLLAITLPDWGVPRGPPSRSPGPNGGNNSARSLTRMSPMIALPVGG